MERLSSDDLLTSLRHSHHTATVFSDFFNLILISKQCKSQYHRSQNHWSYAWLDIKSQYKNIRSPSHDRVRVTLIYHPVVPGAYVPAHPVTVLLLGSTLVISH